MMNKRMNDMAPILTATEYPASNIAVTVPLILDIDVHIPELTACVSM